VWVDLFKIQGFISKRHKPMLNGLRVDFHKTQDSFAKNACLTQSGLWVDSLKT
jgi:hypothetical protein